MSKDAWRAFLNWLDTANLKELQSKLQEANNLLENLTDEELRFDLKRMIRLMEEEMVIRLGIQGRLPSRKRP
jgi:hypothetical protein